MSDGAREASAILSKMLRLGKNIFSTLLTFLAMFYIGAGISNGHAPLPGPFWAHFMILFCVLILLGYLEGLQVAILALEGQDATSWKDKYPRAHVLHCLANRGNNVQRFLVGRQFYVIFVVFLCSQVSTFPTFEKPEWLPAALWFVLVETGLPGAITVLAFGQLMPQLMASSWPVSFCNLPGSWTVLQMTLLLEATGVPQFSWVLTDAVSCVTGMNRVEKQPCGETEKDLEIVMVVDDSTSKGRLQSSLSRIARIQRGWQRLTKETSSLKEEVRVLLAAAQPSLEAAPSPSIFVDKEMAFAGMNTADVVGKVALEYKRTPQADTYPTPAEIVSGLLDNGADVPCFLLPPDHKDHVPPHIVAYSLMANIMQQKDAEGSSSPKQTLTSSPKLASMPPPLAVIPPEVNLQRLNDYRSQYQQFRIGAAAGAIGEICEPRLLKKAD
eukprot:TRINITY_DN19537_c0_g1_i1.p1 TRINITY_DN19537_c0_g1~~TRINITY_DN19537_c0_g1_i1.p1  ORF type:complete len:457 (+),score=81.07 TRINITY_DN19537_c0_g1_i1:49-1371(+)